MHSALGSVKPVYACIVLTGFNYKCLGAKPYPSFLLGSARAASRRAHISACSWWEFVCECLCNSSIED